jgi:TRAP-type C4-dicarboxylate transport system permease small subunit
VAKVFGYLAFTLGILYITYLYIRIFKEKLNKLWRSSLFMLITFFFVIIIAVLFYWGGFNIFNYSVSQIMLALCLSNAYSFYLQYMYCPTNE